MQALLAAALLLSIASPSTMYAQGHNSLENQQSASKQANSRSPIALQVGRAAPKPRNESAKTRTQDWHLGFSPPSWSNWALVIIAFIAATVAISTLRAINAQVVEMRNTGVQTDKLINENIAQSRSMAESVNETARSARAMEGIAKSLEITAAASQQAAVAAHQSIDNLRQQMRAWLTVIIGGGVYQERDKNLKFDARPLILNTGLTPAKNVRYQIKAAILPTPLPPEFAFPQPEEDLGAGGNYIGAHQNAQMMAVVDDYVPDETIEGIKIGEDLALYAWGVVTYDDVFGGSHKTDFCQQLTYLPDGKVFGYYTPGRNDAD